MYILEAFKHFPFFTQNNENWRHWKPFLKIKLKTLNTESWTLKAETLKVISKN